MTVCDLVEIHFDLLFVELVREESPGFERYIVKILFHSIQVLNLYLGKPSNKKTVKIGDIVPFGQSPP